MSVTVLITCYNEGAYIGQALESVLDQTAKQQISAIYILDDGSDEETVSAIRALEGRDPRLEIHYLPGRGVAINRNRGLQLCRTEYIAFLDGDDYWAPEKLRLQLDAFEKDPAVGLVYTGYYAFKDGDADRQRPIPVVDLSRFPDQARGYFLNDPPIFPSCVLVRRSAILALDELFVGECTPFEDFDLFFRLSRSTPFKGLDQPLLHKRYRRGSLSSRSQKLMMRHAFVAFRAASFEPRLLALAPARVGERARRLAMVYLYEGDFTSARRLALTAMRMASFSPKSWVTFALALGGRASRRVLTRLFSSRINFHLN